MIKDRVRHRGTAALACLAVAMLTVHSGCNTGPHDEVIVDGSSTVLRISKAAQERYHKVQPNTLVVVYNHGTGGGFGRYLQGEVDLVDASRQAKPEEESRANAQGLGWTRFTVGYDGITLVVNPRNRFVQSLSVAQLKELWRQDSRVKTWNDLDPAWPNQRIVLYSPDDDSGTFEFFNDAILGKGQSPRSDVQQNADDNTIVTGVAGDPNGIGYFGYAYFAANSDKVRAVAVQDGPDARPVLPSPETILSQTYKPLSRPLFVYAKRSSLRRPAVARFVKFYLDDVAELASQAGYVPPTADDRAANRAAWPHPAPEPGAGRTVSQVP